jgi:hypothetical protein
MCAARPQAVRKELHSRGVTALRTTELAQGKTSRWALAWSWQVGAGAVRAARGSVHCVSWTPWRVKGHNQQPTTSFLGGRTELVS